MVAGRRPLRVFPEFGLDIFGPALATSQSMVRKNVKRSSENIMLNQEPKAR